MTRRWDTIDGALPPLHIVSLADRGVTGKFRQRDWLAFAQRLGRRITFEHICLPPSPILVSDLRFVEQYGDAVPAAYMTAVRDAVSRLRAASFLIVDDVAEMGIPGAQAYGALSHALTRDPRTDLITVRRQRYPARHHVLPTTFVAGIDLPLSDRTASLDRLSAELDKPIFRVATVGVFAAFTADWDFRSIDTPAGSSAGRDTFAPADLLDTLERWIAAHALQAPKRAPECPFDTSDLGHFCSHLVSAAALDAVLDRYDRFCLAGQEASVPYARAALAARGKAFVVAPHYMPTALAEVEDAAFDVILALGPQGPHPTPVPVVSIDDTGPVPNPADDARYTVSAEQMPPSATDWYGPATFDRSGNLPVYRALTRALNVDAAAVSERRLLRRQQRSARPAAIGKPDKVADSESEQLARQAQRRADVAAARRNTEAKRRRTATPRPAVRDRMS